MLFRRRGSSFSAFVAAVFPAVGSAQDRSLATRFPRRESRPTRRRRPARRSSRTGGSSPADAVVASRGVGRSGGAPFSAAAGRAGVPGLRVSEDRSAPVGLKRPGRNRPNSQFRAGKRPPGSDPMEGRCPECAPMVAAPLRNASPSVSPDRSGRPFRAAPVGRSGVSRDGDRCLLGRRCLVEADRIPGALPRPFPSLPLFLPGQVEAVAIRFRELGRAGQGESDREGASESGEALVESRNALSEGTDFGADCSLLARDEGGATGADADEMETPTPIRETIGEPMTGFTAATLLRRRLPAFRWDHAEPVALRFRELGRGRARAIEKAPSSRARH